MSADPDPRLARAVADACDACGIKPADRFLVQRQLDRPTAAQACCGSDCDPCVDDVVEAAALARRLLKARAEGS